MANRKYDYSDEAPRPAEAGKTPEVTAEEARRQRLEQRNDALANEFRKLKAGDRGRAQEAERPH